MAAPPTPFPLDAASFDMARADADATNVVAALADRVAGTMQMARALVEAGRAVDLTGLDREVGVLSARALDLAPEAGRRLRPCLIALRDELDRLTEALRQGHPATD